MSESEVRNSIHSAMMREPGLSARVFTMDTTLAVSLFRDRLFADLGPLSLQLTLEQARLLRDLLDAGLRDAADAGHVEATGYRVDLVKAVA
ncbi:hypothetical protein IU449_00125 [Nocardia higoensis]|uniref:Uncharacterized protein n=1 Tax=Nocardia higoensis TaxID=228599 RepID=A0ABS0D5M7_9NOCA|nr:hypothetical protein [Nocardia higoensis]MBF6352967.1 hypothetical protein [Nocardia higoensis]